MIEILTQDKQKLLEELYLMTILGHTQGFTDGNLADAAFDIFNSKQVRQKFDEISEVVDQCVDVEDGGIILNNCDGTLYYQQNEGNGNGGLDQRIYQKEELEDKYKLNVVAIERDREIGAWDMGIYISNEDDSVVFNIGFKCETNNRLTSRQLVYFMSAISKCRVKYNIPSLNGEDPDKLRGLLGEVIDRNIVNLAYSYCPVSIKGGGYKFIG